MWLWRQIRDETEMAIQLRQRAEQELQGVEHMQAQIVAERDRLLEAKVHCMLLRI
jgi:hypothetical protein